MNAMANCIDHIQVDHALCQTVVTVALRCSLPDEIVFRFAIKEISCILENQPIHLLGDNYPRAKGIILMRDAVVKRLQD